MKNFYKYEWQFFLTKLLRPFIFVLILFVAIAIAVFIVNSDDLEAAFSGLKGLERKTELSSSLTPALQCLLLFLGNMFAASFTVAFGLLPYLFLPFLVLFVNANILGNLLVLGHKSGGILMMIAGILPHGLFEFPAIFYALSLGLVFCLQRTRERRKIGGLFSIRAVKEPQTMEITLSRIGRILAFIVAPLMLVAAIIESFITPLILKRFIF